MNLILLETKEQFKRLKQGDYILVKWSNYNLKHDRNINKIMLYPIEEIKEKEDEIICKMPENHYFNWKRYLKGLSGAEEVYFVETT
ncbi:MAG: hypothetical protein ACOCQR_03010 [bacterium]